MPKNLIKTKPTYAETVATDDGWVDSKTGELLVAIKNLKSRLGEVPVKRKPGRPKKVKDVT